MQLVQKLAKISLYEYNLKSKTIKVDENFHHIFGIPQREFSVDLFNECIDPVYNSVGKLFFSDAIVEKNNKLAIDFKWINPESGKGRKFILWA